MKVSIITAVFNNKKTITDCLKSVWEQSYPDIEHIVIDGGSTDGTQQEIEKYKYKLGYYNSEPDGGIYDAFNKGIRRATGDVVGILNSDDLLSSVDTVKTIVQAFKTSNADLVYGKGVFVNQGNVKRIERIYPSNPFKKIYLSFGWIPLHPTIYVRREIYLKYGLYNTSYAIAGDYEISLRWFQNDNIHKFFLNARIVRMRLGGKSTTLNLQKRKSAEDYKIIKDHKLIGLFTLCFKIARKVPHYLIPQIRNLIYRVH